MAQKRCFLGKKRRFRRKNFRFPKRTVRGGGGVPPFSVNFFPLTFRKILVRGGPGGGYPPNGKFPCLGFLTPSLNRFAISPLLFKQHTFSHSCSLCDRVCRCCSICRWNISKVWKVTIQIPYDQMIWNFDKFFKSTWAINVQDILTAHIGLPMEPNQAIFYVTLRGFDITSVAFVTDIYI